MNRARLIVDATSEEATALLGRSISGLAAAGDVASVWLHTSASAELVGLVQGTGAAALIADDPTRAEATGADGVHLTTDMEASELGLARLAEARQTLGAERIVGAFCGVDRHAAMSLAEAGADYIALDAALDAEIVSWWARVFEVPVVAVGLMQAQACRPLAEAGVEFFAIPPDAAQVAAVETVLAAAPFAEVSA